MPSSHNLQHAKSDLRPHWIVVVAAATTLAVYLFLCHYTGTQWQLSLPEEQRVIIRTVFYVLAIIGFPMTNLIRHIQLRLNQTMPGDKPAKNRYLLTLIVSMTLAESIGVMGLVMYLLGDDFNTLYIFTLLSGLAIYLYRPKMQEYLSILEALAANEQD
ncbi:MAG: hypothetical protein ACU85E_12245 [Gammaproteobacteria bacterium]